MRNCTLCALEARVDRWFLFLLINSQKILLCMLAYNQMHMFLCAGHLSTSSSLAAINICIWFLMSPVLDDRKREMMLHFHHSLADD